jgi:hypothetical protein
VAFPCRKCGDIIMLCVSSLLLLCCLLSLFSHILCLIKQSKCFQMLFASYSCLYRILAQLQLSCNACLSTKLLMIKFVNILLYQIYLISQIFLLDSRILALILVLGQIYLTYGEHIRCIRHIRLSVGFQSLSIGSKSDISDLGWIYPTRQTYPTIGQVPEP